MEESNQRTTASEVQRRLKEKSEQIDRHIKALRDEVAQMGPSIRESVGNHPYISLGGALAVGVVVGILLSRPQGSGGTAALSDAQIVQASKEAQDNVNRGVSAEDAVQTAIRKHMPAAPGGGSTAGGELVRLVAPLLVAGVTQLLASKGSSGAGDEDA